MQKKTRRPTDPLPSTGVEEAVAPSTGSTSSSPGMVLWLFLSIGWQSFGGGSTTYALIHRTFVVERQDLTDAEFLEANALCSLTPGINLIALAALIGKRVARGPGIIAAVAGLMLPSAGITLLITACFASIQHRPDVVAALRAIIPATVGLGLLTAWRISVPLLQAARAEGRGALILSCSIVAGSAVCTALLHLPVVLTLLAAGALLACLRALDSRR